METKQCKKCEKLFPATKEYFYKQSRAKDGFCPWCKQCHSKYAKSRYLKDKEKNNKRERERYAENRGGLLEYQRAYYEENREERLEYQSTYYEKNKEKRKEYGRQYYQKNKEKMLAKVREYQSRPEIKERTAEYVRNKKLDDPSFKIASALRTRLNNALNKKNKVGSAIDDLGCTIDELRIHLESQFQPGMSWDNHSHDGWHIDHIIPLGCFDLTDREQFLQACHYTNLQPLWAKDNLTKQKSKEYFLN